MLVHMNKDVTEAIQKVAAAYDCNIVEGVLSHQRQQFVIDGNKVILSVSNSDTKVDEAEFEENEVYAVDILASTGDGKPKLLDEKLTTVYKRAVDRSYHLKMKASMFIFSEISHKFPIMPFTASEMRTWCRKNLVVRQPMPPSSEGGSSVANDSSSTYGGSASYISPSVVIAGSDQDCFSRSWFFWTI